MPLPAKPFVIGAPSLFVPAPGWAALPDPLLPLPLENGVIDGSPPNPGFPSAKPVVQPTAPTAKPKLSADSATPKRVRDTGATELARAAARGEREVFSGETPCTDTLWAEKLAAEKLWAEKLAAEKLWAETR